MRLVNTGIRFYDSASQRTLEVEQTTFVADGEHPGYKGTVSVTVRIWSKLDAKVWEGSLEEAMEAITTLAWLRAHGVGIDLK